MSHWQIRRDLALLVRHGIHVAQLRELTVFVGDEVDRRARQERTSPAVDAVPCGRVSIHRSQRAGVDVGDVQIALVDRDVFPQQQLAVIRRPVERVPGVLLAADDEPRRALRC